jgi:ribose 5-phosphate isomerase B
MQVQRLRIIERCADLALQCPARTDKITFPLLFMESSTKAQSKKPRIAVGADHAGYQAKETIKKYLTEAGYNVSDEGTWSEDSVDYPDFAVKVARRVQQGQHELGILVCGTGIGMAMAANKVDGIRAAVAHDEVTARMSREHNDANILALGARVLSEHQIISVAMSFLNAQFAGGRHQQRVDKISELDQELRHRHE